MQLVANLNPALTRTNLLLFAWHCSRQLLDRVAWEANISIALIFYNCRAKCLLPDCTIQSHTLASRTRLGGSMHAAAPRQQGRLPAGIAAGPLPTAVVAALQSALSSAFGPPTCRHGCQHSMQPLPLYRIHRQTVEVPACWRSISAEISSSTLASGREDARAHGRNLCSTV